MASSSHFSLEASLAAGASKATYTGGATSVTGWLVSSEMIAYGGFLLALAGLVVNVYFKIRDDKRSQKLHDAQIDRLRVDGNVDL